VAAGSGDFHGPFGVFLIFDISEINQRLGVGSKEVDGINNHRYQE